MRITLRVGRVAALALLVVLGLRGSGLSADEEAAQAWLADGSYEAAGAVQASSLFQVWRRTDPAPSERGETTVLTLLRQDEDVVREAYDIGRAPELSMGGGELLVVRRRLQADEGLGSRILEMRGTIDETGLELARELVTRLLEVEERWLTGTRLLEQAAQAQNDPADTTARGLLREATRALERARMKAPWHLGVLCDLMAAYQLLLPYEVGTDRGANISFLWRECCDRWLDGVPTDEEGALATMCLLTCAFTEGCYPWAATLIESPALAGRDEEVAPLRQALSELGQTALELVEPVTLSGPRGQVQLITVGCPSEPSAGPLAWHRRVWLTFKPDGKGAPLPVWFSLSLEGEPGARRWALVGWVGGSRRVLRLFGAAEPETATVDELVKGLIQGTADAPEVK